MKDINIIPRSTVAVLRQWHLRKKKKPLLVYDLSIELLSDFGFKYYNDIVWIDYQKAKHFLSNVTPESSIIEKLEMISGRRIDREKTLIIITDIGEIDQIKKIAENLDGYYNKYSVIMATSNYELLSNLINYDSLQIKLMKSISFEDFLKTTSQIGSSIYRHFTNKEEYLTSIKTENYNSLREKFILFLILGADPVVISQYLKSNDLAEIDTLKRNIIAEKRINIYENNSDIDGFKMNYILSSMEKQHNDRYDRFKYNLVKDSARQRNYIEPINKIVSQGYLNRVAYTVDIFKLFHLDTGMHISHLDIYYKKLIIYQHLPKSVLETYVVNSLLSHNDSELNYVITQSKNIQPYIWTINGNRYAIFVGGRHQVRFINNFADSFDIKMSIKIGDYNLSYTDDILFIPTFFTDNILDFIAKAKKHGGFIPEIKKRYSIY